MILSRALLDIEPLGPKSSIKVVMELGINFSETSREMTAHHESFDPVHIKTSRHEVNEKRF
jgi:hypothetical protein